MHLAMAACPRYTAWCKQLIRPTLVSGYVLAPARRRIVVKVKLLFIAAAWSGVMWSPSSASLSALASSRIAARAETREMLVVEVVVVVVVVVMVVLVKVVVSIEVESVWTLLLLLLIDGV
jgi:hypothetical protein